MHQANVLGRSKVFFSNLEKKFTNWETRNKTGQNKQEHNREYKNG